MKTLASLLLAGSLLFVASGCSTLIPKPVELFQKKVQVVPTYSPADIERQREAAALAAIRAQQALEAAQVAKSATNVVGPVADVVRLTRAVSSSLGVPASVPGNVNRAASKLYSSVNALEIANAKYAKAADKLAGKKIEGTGLISVPYFMWLGGVVLGIGFIVIVLKVLWTLLKAYGTTNPLVSLGTSGVSLLSSELGKGFQQLIAGGEDFKNAIEKEFGSGSTVSNKILALFTTAHQTNQDVNVQAAVQQLTLSPAPVSTPLPLVVNPVAAAVAVTPVTTAVVI